MKKFFVLITFIAVLLTACSANKNITSKDFTEEQLDSSKYDVEKYTTPFWKGNIVYNECVFPIYSSNATIEPFSLMYDASEIISVKSFSLDKEYVEGKDYILDNGNLVILPTGDIEVNGYSFIHREGIPDKMPEDLIVNLNKDGTEYFTNMNTLLKKSIVVTYIHNDKIELPIVIGKDKIKNTLKRLKQEKETTIVVTGDSISVGYGSSKDAEFPPYADGYVKMVEKALNIKYKNAKINMINSAVGGSTAEFTEKELEDKVVKYNPSLVIMAFGANDGMYEDKSENYAENINKRIKYISEKLPDCEILLVTSIIPNSKIFDSKNYINNVEKLYSIAEDKSNVAICDPQLVQRYLMNERNKDFLCFMSDNLVHPNDYGMRIIAQCVLEALGAV